MGGIITVVVGTIILGYVSTIIYSGVKNKEVTGHTCIGCGKGCSSEKKESCEVTELKVD